MESLFTNQSWEKWKGLEPDELVPIVPEPVIPDSVILDPESFDMQHPHIERGQE